MNELDINGIQTSIGIRTLIGKQNQSSGEKAKRIRLPSTFTRNDIPRGQSKPATPIKLNQWKHLDLIPGENGGNESITVSFLIGANYLKALETLEVIPSQGNRTYAIRTGLGWRVIGPIDMEVGKTICCNSIAVTEASIGDSTRHHFANENKCCKLGIREMLMKQYMQDFVKPNATKDETCDILQEVSYEDKNFIKMTNEKTVKIGRHYQTPLQFRSKEMHFPNNRKLAESRLVGIKRWMLRDKQFTMHYKGFIKGYAI